MKQRIIIMLLLFVSCSTLKHTNNKELVKLYVYEIQELNSSYVLETINNANDTVLVIVPKSDFTTNKIVKNQTYQFETIRMKLRVPHMQELMYIQPPYIAFGTDTICKCTNLKDCPVTYLFKSIE
jgi:hypothetical protein